MGKLIRNGIEYGGGNGTDIFEVTQAEYDALVLAGTLVHNALYVLTDAPNLNATSEDLSYDGGATNTHDEVEKRAINTDASPLFKTKSTGALSKSFNANAYSAFSANDIGLSITGYTPVAVLNADNNNANVILNGYNLSATGSATMFLYRNVSTSSQTASFTFTLLFARNDIVKAVT